MKYRSILLFGAPGAGKGTHGRVLGVIPNFFHCAGDDDCAGDDVFRHLRADSPLGRGFIEFSGRGQWVHRINADQPPAPVLADILRCVVK